MIIGADSESALCIAPEYDEENKYIAMMEQCGLLDRFEMVFITEKTMTTEIIPLINAWRNMYFPFAKWEVRIGDIKE